MWKNHIFLNIYYFLRKRVWIMCVSKNLLILTFHKLKHSISIKVLSFTCRKCINCDLDFGIDFNPYVNNSLANIHIKVFYFFIKRFLCPARLLLFGTFLIKLPKFVVKIYYYIILVIDIRVKLLMSDTDKKVPSIPKAIRTLNVSISLSSWQGKMI